MADEKGASAQGADGPCASLTLRLDPAALAVGKEATCHFVAEVRGLAGPVDKQRPRLDVVCCLDTSGSMNGEPLEQVAASVVTLVDLLEETDRLSIVVFSDRASVFAPLVATDRIGKATLKRRAQSLSAGGGTNMAEGLEVAAEVFAGSDAPDAGGASSGEVRRRLILLLSDGQPNVGPSDPDALSQRVAAHRPGASVSTLGYGHHHKEDVLKAMADAGGGAYYFVSNPEEAEVEFARALGAQGDTVADSVVLSFLPAEGVEVEELLGVTRTSFSPKGLSTPLPDLLEGMPRFVVGRARVTARPDVENAPFLHATLTARRAGTARSETLTVDLVAPFRPSAGPPDPLAHPRVLLASAEVARRAARRLADQGGFDGAAAVLRKLMATIEADPCYQAGDGSDLSEAYEQILDEAVAYERKPSQEAYQHFRKATLGMDLQSGAKQASDYLTGSSRVYLDSVAGDLPDAVAVVTAGSLQGRAFPLGSSNTIGRTAEAEICVPSSSVSRRHTRVVAKGGRFIISDLGSSNGTHHNGKRIHGPVVLKDGDIFSVGDVAFRFELRGNKLGG